MTDACLPRNPENLLAAVAAEDVTRAPDLQPGFGGVGFTHCNAFAERVCQRLGAPLLHGLLANQQERWLDSAGGRASGWAECTGGEALDFVAAGQVVLATWFNPQPPPHDHGHIAVVVPSLGGPDDGVHVAAAGSTNYENTPIRHSFGNLPVRFFHHS